MTYNYHHQIDRLIKANKIYRFKNELTELSEDLSDELINDRKKTLSRLIKLYEDYKDEKQIKEDIMKAHLKVLNDSQYQKKWQFLNIEQKLNRYNEYMERFEIKDDNIINSLKAMIQNNSVKSKDIKYDNIKGCIDNITILLKNDKNEYYINNENIKKKL